MNLPSESELRALVQNRPYRRIIGEFTDKEFLVVVYESIAEIWYEVLVFHEDLYFQLFEEELGKNWRQKVRKAIENAWMNLLDNEALQDLASYIRFKLTRDFEDSFARLLSAMYRSHFGNACIDDCCCNEDRMQLEKLILEICEPLGKNVRDILENTRFAHQLL